MTLHLILMLNTTKIQMKKILNMKLVITLEFHNKKTFLQKDTFQIDQRKFLLLVKLKTRFLVIMQLVTSRVKKLLEVFTKKNCKYLYVKWKWYDQSFNSWIGKNITHVDNSSFALKTNLPNLKAEVDKLNTDKIKPASVHLSKLSNVVKNEVVKDCVW